jgi:hypothetical protein
MIYLLRIVFTFVSTVFSFISAVFSFVYTVFPSSVMCLTLSELCLPSSLKSDRRTLAFDSRKSGVHYTEKLLRT